MVNKTLGVDTLTDAERDTIDLQDDTTLVEMWQAYRDSANHSRLGYEYVEYVLQARMTVDGASVLPSTTHDVKVNRSYDTDANVLGELRELIDPAILAEAYTPEHQEKVPEKWNMTKVNAFKRYGDAVVEIIERSRLWSPPRISIKKKR